MFVHDAAGNMTTMPQPLAPGSPYALKYDAWNRLVEVKDGNTIVQSNEYDGLNRRIVRTSGGASRHFYYNQQWQVLEERVGSSTTADKQFVYHPHYVDAIAMRLNANGDEHYYLQDANFNVTAVVDNTGTVKERYAYTPYGEVTILDLNFSAVPNNVSTISNEHLYTGRRRDPKTGLQLNRNRFYASGLGRWVNRDPIGYIGGDYNLYEYVNSRSTFYVDPQGKQSLNPWNPPYQPGFPPFGPSFNPFPPDTLCKKKPDEPPCDNVPPWDMLEEAGKRRGSAGPGDDSSHHCWAACMCSQMGGVLAGTICAGIESLTELPVAWKFGWNDTGDDIKANFRGAGCGAAPSSCPAKSCDDCCGTKKR